MNFNNTLKSFAIASGILLLSGCGEKSETQEDADVDSEATTEDIITMDTADQKLSYAIGYQMAERYSKDEILKLDADLLIKGITDGLAGNENLVSEEDAQAASQEMQTRFQQKQDESSKEARADGVAFLESNKSEEGVVETESGLQYKVLTKGDGDAHPAATDNVKVHYHGTLVDGNVFDSSVDRGEPISFALNGVIKGWTEGVQLMTIGDKFRFFIPSELGYGAQAAGSIPPHSVLIFDVELLGINE